MNEHTEGQQIAPEIQEMLAAADAEAAEFEAMAAQPVVALADNVAPVCIICGEIAKVSRTGRCNKCKSKRLSNNRDKIETAKKRLASARRSNFDDPGVGFKGVTFQNDFERREFEQESQRLREESSVVAGTGLMPPDSSATIAALEQEILQLRHLLAARQPISLADFRERVAICHEAGVEHYEDGAIKLIFNNELRKALVRPMETVPASERVF